MSMAAGFNQVSSENVLDSIGVAVVPVACPVSLGVGAALACLLQWRVRSLGTNAVLTDRAQRQLARASSIIRQHGQMPETALVQTDAVAMKVNSRTWTISGTVMVNDFTGRELDALSADEVQTLIELSTDEDSMDILLAYRTLRKAREQAPSSPIDA